MSSYGKCMDFPINLTTVWENATKLMVWAKSGKLIFIIFPQYGCIFPIRFPSCGILHYMGNAWFSLKIFHTMERCNETHYIGRTWQIGTHNFPIVWVLFSQQIPILWYTSSYVKCMCFLINFRNTEKDSQTHRMGKAWEIGSQ